MYYYTMGNLFSTKKLVIMRGLPGSGKSTHAKEITRNGGVIFSCDDYFKDEAGNYIYERSKLKDSHIWNQKRATDAMIAGVDLIVIDNTNVRKWEAKPYVKMAVECHYEVSFVEPPYWWIYDIDELMSRDDKKVPKKTMERMQRDWESDFTVQNVLQSMPPWEKYSKKRSLSSFDYLSENMNAAYLFDDDFLLENEI